MPSIRSLIRAGAALLMILPLLAACGESPTATPVPTPVPAPTDTTATTPPTPVPAPTDTTAATPPTATPAPAAAAPPTNTAASSGSTVPALVVDKSKLSKELNLYTWVNYMKPEVLDKFQQEY